MSHWLTWVYLKLPTAHCPLVAAHNKGLGLSFFSASGLVLVVRRLTGLHTGTTKGQKKVILLKQPWTGRGWNRDINDSAFHSPSGWFWGMFAHYRRGFQWQQAPIAFSRNLIIAMHFIVYVTLPNSSVIFLQVSFQSNSWDLSYCLRIYCKERSKETSRSGGAQTRKLFSLLPFHFWC